MHGLKTLAYKAGEISYSGAELSAYWIYRKFDLLGDAVVAFTGSARVELDHMVDLVDVKNKAPIASNHMLHFLGEFFIDSLSEAILLQHYLVLLVGEAIYRQGNISLERRGNDLFYQGKKLSVSIATKTTTSCLIHLGINLTSDGTPIPTSNLKELNINEWALAEEVLSRLVDDLRVMKMARVKVLPR